MRRDLRHLLENQQLRREVREAGTETGVEEQEQGAGKVRPGPGTGAVGGRRRTEEETCWAVLELAETGRGWEGQTDRTMELSLAPS